MANWVIATSGSAINLDHVSELLYAYDDNFKEWLVQAYHPFTVEDCQEWCYLGRFNTEKEAKDFILQIIKIQV